MLAVHAAQEDCPGIQLLPHETQSLVTIPKGARPLASEFESQLLQPELHIGVGGRALAGSDALENTSGGVNGVIALSVAAGSALSAAGGATTIAAAATYVARSRAPGMGAATSAATTDASHIQIKTGVANSQHGASWNRWAALCDPM